VSSSQTTNPLTHISNAFNHSTQPQATLQRTQTVSGPSVDALHEMIQSMYTFTQETWNELESKQNEFQRMIHLYTCTPVHPYTRTPVHQYTRTPIHPYTRTPIHLYNHISDVLKCVWHKVDQENNSYILIHPHSLY
jgi:hypothetical protein